MLRRDDYRRDDNQYLNDDVVNNTTTEPAKYFEAMSEPNEDENEEFLDDTESVDRLALDGETREPLNSSTINSYNY